MAKIAMTQYAPPIAPGQADADLLTAFREAAQVEHRLVPLETWLTSERPEPGSRAWRRRWNCAVLRLLKLLSNNPALEPYRDICFAYMRAVFGLAPVYRMEARI